MRRFLVLVVGGAWVAVGVPCARAVTASSDEGPKAHTARSDEARPPLRRAAQRHPDDPVLQYNLGTAWHQRGDYEASGTALNNALAASPPSLVGRIAYNLGNTRYRLAQAQEATAPGDALQRYQQALEAYRMAIQHDPRDHDAQFNYELVERRVARLKEHQAATQEGRAKTASPPSSTAQPGSAPAAETTETSQEAAQARQAESSEQPAPEPVPVESGEGPQAVHPMQGEGSSSSSDATHSDAPEPSVGEAEPSEERASLSREAEEAGELSKREAFWILDAVRQEERGALVQHPQGTARERIVERDW